MSQATQKAGYYANIMMMMMMKLPILPCAEKLELVLSTAPKTWDNTDKDNCHVSIYQAQKHFRPNTLVVTRLQFHLSLV